MSRRHVRAAGALAVAVALLLIYAVRWSQVDHGLIGGSDFSATYVGGSLWRDGHRADLYSDRVQTARHALINAPDPPSALPFVNPPVAAVLAAPLTLLSLDAAYRVWTIAQFSLLVAAVLIALRAAPWPRSTAPLSKPAIAGIALAGVPTIQFVMVGQWDGVGALGVAAAYAAWRRGRRATGAALLAVSAAVAKPHLAIGLAAFLLGWRDRRALAGALAALVAVVAVSLLAAGPAGSAGFLSAGVADATRWPLRSLLGFTGLLGSWLGDTGLAHGLGAVGTLGAAAACLVLGAAHRRRSDLLELSLGGAVVISLVASPHLLLHDLVLLAPVLVWVFAAARRRGAVVVGLWALITAAASLDLGNSLPAPPGRLVPWTLIIAGALAVLAVRRQGRASGVGAAPRPVAGARPALPIA